MAGCNSITKAERLELEMEDIASGYKNAGYSVFRRFMGPTTDYEDQVAQTNTFLLLGQAAHHFCGIRNGELGRTTLFASNFRCHTTGSQLYFRAWKIYFQTL